MWTQILQENNQNVLSALRGMQSRLKEFEQALDENNRESVERLLAAGKQRRDALEVDITPLPGNPDLDGQRVASEAADMGISDSLLVRSVRSYLVQGNIDQAQIERIAERLLADRVVEHVTASPVGDDKLSQPPEGCDQLLHVLRKPGVMDPVAQSAEAAMRDLGIDVDAVRTVRKYWISQIPAEAVERLSSKVLANDSIEQVVAGKLELTKIDLGSPYQFALQHVAIRELSDQQLEDLSKTGQLYLTLPEMKTIQEHFRSLDRDPTDIELESVAQTWSEHCSHKRLQDASPTKMKMASDDSRTC